MKGIAPGIPLCPALTAHYKNTPAPTFSLGQYCSFISHTISHSRAHQSHLLAPIWLFLTSKKIRSRATLFGSPAENPAWSPQKLKNPWKFRALQALHIILLHTPLKVAQNQALNPTDNVALCASTTDIKRGELCNSFHSLAARQHRKSIHARRPPACLSLSSPFPHRR